ncbi:MAG: prolipoprotein diacylglyceryl transferase family protein [Desulforhopalus sp.]
MNDMLFLLGLCFILAHFLGWSFKHLPGERWQMLAVVPIRKGDENRWQGSNLTYYGFFIATSQLISLTLLLILLGAMGLSIPGTMLAILIVLTCCIPAARLMAMLVEKKRHTFTIGGASFVGILLAPWSIQLSNTMLASIDSKLPIIPVLAAMAIAYTLGEGLGRLGCISYGCCYGKPLKDCNFFLQWLFARASFIFYGSTKKVEYEAQLAGEKLLPIQAITCVLYTFGALIGSYLFLIGLFTPALLFTIALTQLWRILSETIRADFRGFGNISAYQKMGMMSVLYILGIIYFVHAAPYSDPEILDGIGVLWDPYVILGLQLLWLAFFFTFGRSTVTTSTISFELIRKHI